MNGSVIVKVVLTFLFIAGTAAAVEAADISGVLSGDTTLDAASSPWYVRGDLTVPAEVTLVIEPGVTVYVAAGERITVNGRLIAEGTEQQSIHITHESPGGTWRGIQFIDSRRDNHISYAVIEYGRTESGTIGVEDSELLIEHTWLGNTDLKRIRTEESSLIVRNCVFGEMFPPDEPPTTDNRSEHIWGSGVPQGGYMIIEGNVFGWTVGHNDAIDFDCPRRPSVVSRVLNNVFLGGGDDALDVEADMHIEGNIFMNYRRDEYNTSTGESNAISAGGAGADEQRDYMVVRNVFTNVHHAAQVKDEAFMTFVNNTVVGVSRPVMYFVWQGRRPGRGAYVENCIFWEAPVIFDGIDQDTELTVNYSLIPALWHNLGRGNVDTDPCFAESGCWDTNGTPNDPNDDFWVGGDYHLKSQAGWWDTGTQNWVQADATSPCIDAGNPTTPIGQEPFPNGGIVNIGAYGGTAEASKSYFGEPICETVVAGDINGDCRVDFEDFAFIALHWLSDSNP